MARHSFKASLESAGNSLHWTIIRMPEKVSQALGTRGQVRVKGALNGFAFQSTLFPDGKGHHMLVVNKTMQKGAGVAAGNSARLEIEADKAERPIETPPELIKALRQDKSVQRYYDGLSSSIRRDISRWVLQAKQPETRFRRAEEMAERLMQVRDGEREPPPILRAAFARDPRAREGWDLLPLSHKRAHLHSIFYCKTPESQARRVEKAVEMTLAYAEKKAK